MTQRRPKAVALVFGGLCLMLLTGCETASTGVTLFPPEATPVTADAPVPGQNAAFADPNDDVSLGKRHFREGNFGMAETHFRRAIEKGPSSKERDAEAWLGLAATYDRLKRFDLADRAYAKLAGLLGRTPELLNNQGYSYMMRGDYRRARAALYEARDKDPTNPQILNNLDLLDQSTRRRG